MSARGRPRPSWRELPGPLRAAVEEVLGSPVVAASSRPGGWSPGSADLVTLADGRTAFVKTADGRVNAETVALHRREAEVLRLLGGGAAPRLLAEVDADPWIALVAEAVDGRHPDPRSAHDTVAVLDAVARLPDAEAGAPLPDLAEDLADEARGWERVRDESAPLPDAVASALPGLVRLAARAREVLRGDSVVHGDLRVDNALIDRVGRGRIVDWPSAARGPRWFDAVTHLLDVRHLGGPVEAGLRHPVLRDVPEEHVEVLLAVLGAYFFDRSRRPEPAGLPGIRAYQRAQGDTVVAWLLERRPDLG